MRRSVLATSLALATTSGLACGAFGTANTGSASGGDAAQEANPAPDAGSTLKRWTFEDGKLVHPTSGADEIKGAVQLLSTGALVDGYSARVGTGQTWLREVFPTTAEITITMVLRVDALPSSEKRIVRLGHLTEPNGGVEMKATGALAVDNKLSPALTIGQRYRLKLTFRAGVGDGGVEGYLALDDAPFADPFASSVTKTFEPFDSVHVGQIDDPSDAMVVVFDDVTFVGR